MLSVKPMQAVVTGLDSAPDVVFSSFLNPTYFPQYTNAGATAVLDIAKVGSGRFLKTDSYSNLKTLAGL